jgi:Radical SAM superfamily
MVQWGEESCERAVALIRESRANILAIGLPYGTYSSFKKQYEYLRETLNGDKPLVVLGGPIATYLSDKLLAEVAPEAFVILGEAEEALPSLISSWLGNQDYPAIANLHYIDTVTGRSVRTLRRLSDLSSSVLPYRDHTRSIRDHGGQIFTETSRGCSWAACTFCLRGLTDIAGRGYEYRRKTPAVVAADLGQLSRLGITDVTIADEDFLGSSLAATEEFVAGLERAATKIQFPRFDASMTIHSVCSRRDGAVDRATRERLLARLVSLGLRKVFLGVESCSPSQLRRYAKGHTRDEAVAAVRSLQQLGVRVEIGVILFDPLCTLSEIEDSLTFMRSNGLAHLASGLSSELRLQVGSHYMTMLEKFEVSRGLMLHQNQLDPDTLAFPYRFATSQVQQLFDSVGAWNRRVHSIYYPAKNLSRFGATGAVGEAVYPLRQATEQFRLSSCDAILRAIAALKSGADCESVLGEGFCAASASLASAVLASVGTLASSHTADHPVLRRATAAAEAVQHEMRHEGLYAVRSH